MASLERLRILLLQARRGDDPAREHERSCFLERTRLRPDQVVCHSVENGIPSLAEARRYDAFMMGGAGEFDVSKRNVPGFEALCDLLTDIASTGHATYASCFGYQCMVQALGGDVRPDPDRAELGTYPIQLSTEGRSDPLFGTLPPRFWGQMGHKERAVRAAPATVNLASTENSPLQALRIPGKPVWASQFHPELDHHTNRERFHNYVGLYRQVLDEEEIAAVESRFRESPEASDLLRRFLELVFGDGPGRSSRDGGSDS